jgi:hypothetical protein
VLIASFSARPTPVRIRRRADEPHVLQRDLPAVVVDERNVHAATVLYPHLAG